MKETFPDVIDLLRGDAALLEAAKKGNLAKVRINLHFFPTFLCDPPEHIEKGFQMFQEKGQMRIFRINGVQVNIRSDRERKVVKEFV